MKKPNFLGIIIDGSFTISAFGYGSSTAIVGICIDKQMLTVYGIILVWEEDKVFSSLVHNMHGDLKLHNLNISATNASSINYLIVYKSGKEV